MDDLFVMRTMLEPPIKEILYLLANILAPFESCSPRHFQHVPTRPVHYVLKPLWGLSYLDLKKRNSQK